MIDHDWILLQQQKWLEASVKQVVWEGESERERERVWAREMTLSATQASHWPQPSSVSKYIFLIFFLTISSSISHSHSEFDSQTCAVFTPNATTTLFVALQLKQETTDCDFLLSFGWTLQNNRLMSSRAASSFSGYYTVCGTGFSSNWRSASNWLLWRQELLL